MTARLLSRRGGVPVDLVIWEKPVEPESAPEPVVVEQPQPVQPYPLPTIEIPDAPVPMSEAPPDDKRKRARKVVVLPDGKVVRRK